MLFLNQYTPLINFSHQSLRFARIYPCLYQFSLIVIQISIVLSKTTLVCFSFRDTMIIFFEIPIATVKLRYIIKLCTESDRLNFNLSQEFSFLSFPSYWSYDLTVLQHNRSLLRPSHYSMCSLLFVHVFPNTSISLCDYTVIKSIVIYRVIISKILVSSSDLCLKTFYSVFIICSYLVSLNVSDLRYRKHIFTNFCAYPLLKTHRFSPKAIAPLSL